jgi:hypothetical protein
MRANDTSADMVVKQLDQYEKRILIVHGLSEVSMLQHTDVVHLRLVLSLGTLCGQPKKLKARIMARSLHHRQKSGRSVSRRRYATN